MKEDYVSLETAKLLKEKGFDSDCNAIYDLEKPKSCADGKLYFNFDNKNPNRFHDLCAAPTLQMAMKWLREVHHIEILITCGFPTIDGVCQFKYFWCIVKVNLRDKRLEYPMDCLERMADTFESACSSAIEYCLTNLI